MKEVTGFVGVIDGKPVFGSMSDEKGDCRTIDVYATAEQALARWAWARKVRIVYEDEPIWQDPKRGRL